MTPWEIRTIEFANCNCAYGCPCQFNAYPTNGNCEAVVCNEITEGHLKWTPELGPWIAEVKV